MYSQESSCSKPGPSKTWKSFTGGFQTKWRIMLKRDRSLFDYDHSWVKAKQKQRALQQKKKQSQLNERDQAWVAAATRDALTWCTQHTKTYNEHWKEEGRDGPYEKFPTYDYFRDLFDGIEQEQITWIEKSRDLMISWACVGC